MPLNSMTGFARADGTHGDDQWHWEIRGVNARGLDIRLRLGSGLEHLETKIRDAIKKRLSRGNISVSLNLARAFKPPRIRVNEEALAVVRAAAEKLRDEVKGAPISAEALLGLRGVLETDDNPQDDAETDELDKALLESFAATFDEFCCARSSEGSHLTQVIATQVDDIEQLKQTIENSASRTPEKIAERMGQQIARLTDGTAALEPERLHQEAVIVATRADIEEELKRLDAHISAARNLLAAAEPVGRKFDFLAQEFNRETNTICSKSIAVDITQAALAMKVIVDQLREQAQNVE